MTHYRLDIVQDARRLGRGRRRAPGGDDPADGVGRVRHRQHRVPGAFGRSPTHHRSSPSAAPAGRRPRRRSSGPSTCSPPSSGRDPAEIRRLNLIAPFRDPHSTSIGQTYDVGDYVGALDRVLAAAGYDELRAEQRRRREAGDRTLLGIGVSVYVEITNSIPGNETATIEVAADGQRRRLHRHVPARPGPRDGLGDDRRRAHRPAGLGDPCRLGRHRRRAHRRRNARVTLAADRRGGGRAPPPSSSSTSPARVAADRLEADVADVVLDTERGSFHVAGTPAVTLTWADVASGLARRRHPTGGDDDVRLDGADVPVRRPRRRRRGRRRDRPRPPRPPRGVRRRRAHRQPAARRGPAARRHRLRARHRR